MQETTTASGQRQSETPTPAQRRDLGRLAARVSMAVVFIVIGVVHFLAPAPFLSIMPTWVPAKREVNLVTGALEIAGGVALLARGKDRRVGWLLAALLVLVFPANINQAVQGIQLENLPELPRWAMWSRLPMQAVMIWAVLYGTGAIRARSGDGT